MFDNYYDTVSWKHKTGLDKSNKEVYDAPVEINLRYAKGKDILYNDAKGTGSKTKYTYHCPVNIGIEKGDLIDGHKVVSKKPSHGIGKEIFFYVLEVE